MRQQFPEAPLDVRHTVANHFHRDGVDFLRRFDALWEHGLLMDKMGRTKTFVDLLLACECTLKAHILLGSTHEDVSVTYKRVRNMGHRIDKLAAAANLMEDRATYDFFANQLAGLGVGLRYSLDAYDSFFPWMLDRADAPINYSATVGNHAWVMTVRERIATAQACSGTHFGGMVTSDVGKLLEHEGTMLEFAKTHMSKRYTA